MFGMLSPPGLLWLYQWPDGSSPLHIIEFVFQSLNAFTSLVRNLIANPHLRFLDKFSSEACKVQSECNEICPGFNFTIWIPLP